MVTVQEILCVVEVCMIELINIFLTSRSHSADHQAPPVETRCYRPLLLAPADPSTGTEWSLESKCYKRSSLHKLDAKCSRPVMTE